MPCRDFDGNHEQLVQDQDRIADGDHSWPVDLGQELGKALDHAALINGHKYPYEERAVGQGSPRCQLLVQLWIQIGQIFINVLVEDQG